MATHRFGAGIEADQLRWKNLVAGVESVLAKQMRRTEVEEFLAQFAACTATPSSGST